MKVGDWRDQFIDNNAPANPDSFPFVLIGNKSDEMKLVEQADIDAFLAKFPGMKYIETCATSGAKVEDAFRTMVEQHEKAASSSGAGLDMPTSLTGATGAVAITAAGD